MSVSGVCRLLGISRQRYYRQKWRMDKSRRRAAGAVELVRAVRMEMPRIGTRKLYHMLRPSLRELHVGRDRLFGILRANRMLIKPVRSYHVTTDSRHRFRRHRDLVAGTVPTRPEEIWVSDITYIRAGGRHMYLSLVTDAYSKRIMGYCLSGSLDTQGPLQALRMANRNRLYRGEPLIHHSDRGIQYCSDAYQETLGRYRMTPSMTETHDPYANAVAERVNGILKQELLPQAPGLSLPDMRRAVRDAVHKYNNLRPHFSCGYMTPAGMHLQRRLRIRCYRSGPSVKAGLDGTT